MMLRTALLFVLLVFVLPARPQSVTASQPDRLAVLPKEVTSLIGTWACKGTFRGGKPHESVYTAASILNGTWVEMTEHDTLPATGFDARYLIGYDPESKKLVEFDANTFGSATYSSTSGWKERSLTVTSEASTNPKAPYALNRFRYAVPSPGAFTIDWEISKSATEQNWITADHLVCTPSK